MRAPDLSGSRRFPHWPPPPIRLLHTEVHRNWLTLILSYQDHCRRSHNFVPREIFQALIWSNLEYRVSRLVLLRSLHPAAVPWTQERRLAGYPPCHFSSSNLLDTVIINTREALSPPTCVDVLEMFVMMLLHVTTNIHWIKLGQSSLTCSLTCVLQSVHAVRCVCECDCGRGCECAENSTD